MSQPALMVVFRRSGWQWPLYSNDAVRVYDPARRLIAELSGALVAALLEHHLAGAALQAQVSGAAPGAAPAGPADSRGVWRPDAAAPTRRARPYRPAPRPASAGTPPGR